MITSRVNTVCGMQTHLRQESLLAMLDRTARTYKVLAAMDPATWRVSSFDPQRQNACVVVTKKCGTTTMSVCLPPLGGHSTAKCPQ